MSEICKAHEAFADQEGECLACEVFDLRAERDEARDRVLVLKGERAMTPEYILDEANWNDVDAKDLRGLAERSTAQAGKLADALEFALEDKRRVNLGPITKSKFYAALADYREGR